MQTIQTITARAWDIPMRAPYWTARRTTTTAHNILVTLTLTDTSTSDHFTGYGESSPPPTSPARHRIRWWRRCRGLFPN